VGSRIVVTGGAGFIGVSVVDALVGRGDDVVVLDSGVAAGLGHVQRSDVRLVEADVRDGDAVAAALTGAAAVVHLAAHTVHAESIADPTLNFEVNVRGTLNVLEAARGRGIRRVVLASSNAVVAGHGPPTNEDQPPNPVSPYGASKAAAEAYLRAYTHAYGIDGVALRFANAYGPRSAHKPSVISSFIRAYLGGGPLRIHGSGDQTRDFVYVDDVRDAIVACLDAPASTISGATFQVGTGRETSLNELAELLFDVGSGPVAVEHRAALHGDVPRNVSDATRLNGALGFRPRVDLREGLGRTLDWFREQRTG
jgi:UDP-glucose 4-epimerase